MEKTSLTSELSFEETNVCYCGEYGGGKHTLSGRCGKRLVLCPNCTYPFYTQRAADDIKQCPACSNPFKLEEKVRR